MNSKKSSQKKPRVSLLITAMAVIVSLFFIIYFGWPFISILGDPDQAKELINGTGAWGPLLYMLMQIIQVLIAPIPGQVIGLLGGYLFGPYLGVLYTLIGATIGFTLIFVLARKLGRPFVEYFVSKKIIDKFDHLTKDKGPFVFFLIFLLPAFPDDVISFIAGLTKIRIRTLILISLAGRLPGYVLLSYTGNGLAYENSKPIIAIAIISVVLFAIAWWKRAWIREFVEHTNRITFVKKTWKASMLSITFWILGITVLSIFLFQYTSSMQ